MRTLQLRDAKASFSAVVDAAQKGEPTTITRHGVPAAMVVPVETARKLFPEQNFGEFLLSFPGMPDVERDTTPMRAADFSDDEE